MPPVTAGAGAIVDRLLITVNGIVQHLVGSERESAWVERVQGDPALW